MRKIRKGDEVLIIKGKEKGKKGKVLEILNKGQRVKVERLNMMKKHKRATERYVHSGIQTKEAPVYISNVRLINKKTQKPLKVKFGYITIEKENKKILKKIRISAKTGEHLD